MSDQRSSGKLNQIIQNFFAKAVAVVANSRVDSLPRSTGKVNKWFNIEFEESPLFKDDLKLWKSCDVSDSSTLPPALVIETYLDLRFLTHTERLVLVDPNGKSWPVANGTAKSEVVLERWIVDFHPAGQIARSKPGSVTDSSPASATGDDPNEQVDLHLIYKKAIILFRSMFHLAMLLPAWELKVNLAMAKLNVPKMALGCRVLNGAQPISSRGRIGLTKAVMDQAQFPDQLSSYLFESIETPLGNLRASVNYRIHVDFRIGDSEAILSNHFLHLDEQQQQRQQQQQQKPLSQLSNVMQTASGMHSNSSLNSLASDRPRSPSRKNSLLDNNGPRYSSGSILAAELRQGRDPQRRDSSISSRGTSRDSSRSLSRPRGLSREPSSNASNYFSERYRLDKERRKSINREASPATRDQRPSVAFIQPFKSSSISSESSSAHSSWAAQGASPQAIPNMQSSSGSGGGASGSSHPHSSFSRIASTSSAAALRIPQRSLSNASISSIKSIDNALSSSPSAGSVPRYSSSFGSRHSYKSGSSMMRPRAHSLLSSDASVISASPASVMEPGSGILMPDDTLGDFVRLVDSVRQDHTYTLGSSSGSTNQSRVNLPSDSSPAAGSQSSTNPLARFHQMKSFNTSLSDSLQMSALRDSPSPPIAPGRSPGPSNLSGGVGGAGGGSSMRSRSRSASPNRGRYGHHPPLTPSRLSANFGVDRRYDDDGEEAPGERGERRSSSATRRYQFPPAISRGRQQERSNESRSASRSRSRFSYYQEDHEAHDGRNIVDDDAEDLLFAMSDMHVN